MLKLIQKFLLTTMEYYSNLNTSHVKVNLTANSTLETTVDNLNTSHVKVNRTKKKVQEHNLSNLNTSHVKVNLKDNTTIYYCYN